MSLLSMRNERVQILERLKYIDVTLERSKPPPKHDAPYGCQQYSAQRLCRFDRRSLDRKCDGCERVTDEVELKRMGLWVAGVSHEGAE